MQEIVSGELIDLHDTDVGKFPIHNTVGLIKQKYQRLWNEVNQEGTIGINENYRIQERVRALNALGYSVGNISFVPSASGDRIHFRIIVTDRNFHRNQLFNLTGLQAEEMQARQMMNEILEVQATLSAQQQSQYPHQCGSVLLAGELLQSDNHSIGAIATFPDGCARALLPGVGA